MTLPTVPPTLERMRETIVQHYGVDERDKADMWWAMQHAEARDQRKTYLTCYRALYDEIMARPALR